MIAGQHPRPFIDYVVLQKILDKRSNFEEYQDKTEGYKNARNVSVMSNHFPPIL